MIVIHNYNISRRTKFGRNVGFARRICLDVKLRSNNGLNRFFACAILAIHFLGREKMKMKIKLFKVISILVLLTTMLVSLISCQCGHRDANDNTVCDKCGATHTDGKDIPEATVCQHRDVDDNTVCDKCGATYTDGKYMITMSKVFLSS